LPGTGGGGGGDAVTNGAVSGGGGVVRVRYSSNFRDLSGTSGSPSYSDSGGFKSYTWTGVGSFTI
jgi:hypothetical protein